VEQILSAPVQRVFARRAPRYDSITATSPNPVSQTSDSARVASLDVLHDVVIELIHALKSVLNEEGESAVRSLQRSAELLNVSAHLPEFNAIKKIASDVARGGLAPWQARIVKTHIDTHLGGSLRTKDLAQLVQLSSFHFCRVFRVSFGHSPHTYVTRRRVESAQGLMRSTNLALGRIGLDCGFADQAHFTKTFRRLCGVSPGEWRRTRAGAMNASILPGATNSGGLRKASDDSG
jgi:AraC family transcriptional regulator